MVFGRHGGAAGEVEVHVGVAGQDGADLPASVDARGHQAGELEREVFFQEAVGDARGVVARALVMGLVAAGIALTTVARVDDDRR